MQGTIIGQYRIVQQIGAGGMGVVYVAEHVLVGRRAAIKVLLPEYSVRRARRWSRPIASASRWRGPCDPRCDPRPGLGGARRARRVLVPDQAPGRR
jgi:serine/threonine protein kinase